MDTRKITCMAAATIVGSLLILSTVGPAHAQQPVIVQGHQYIDPETQRVVPYGDLNLANASGQKRLIRRVGYAVNDLCGGSAFMGAGSYDLDCTKAAWDSANPQITTAFERARSNSGYLSAVAVTVNAPR